MSYYGSGDWRDTALICENGHIINSAMKNNPEFNKNHCPECGAKTINECPNCKKAIQGEMHYDGVIGFGGMTLPKYCHECGEAYPWTIKEMDAAKELISLTDLTKEEQTEFINSLTDIGVEGPRNKVGIAKTKIFLGKIGNGLREDVKEVVTNVAAEVIKDQIKRL